MVIKGKYQTICNLFWLLIGLTICVASIQLKLGTPSDPGPGFMPFGTGLLLISFSLPTLFMRIREEENEASGWAGPYWKRVVATIISLFCYAFFVTNLGYLITTFLLMFFLFWTSEHKKLMIAVIKAVFSTGITYLIFDRLLDCQLPKGLFGF